MQSPEYLQRMEAVLAARVEERKQAEAPRHRTVLQVGGSMATAIALFFLLKAAALAISGQPFAAPPAAEAGLGARLHHWFAGADPVTRTLAEALRPATTSRSSPSAAL